MYLLEGLPKQGKSYELVRMTYDWISHGVQVATNMTVDYNRMLTYMKNPERAGKLFKIERLADIENYTDGVIIIDEAPAFIHARDWANMTPAMRQKFSQHMHDGLDVWLAAQEFETVDPIVRGLLAFCYRVEKSFLGTYTVDTFTPSTRKINRNESRGRKRHRFKKKFMYCYNFKELRRIGDHVMIEMADYVRLKNISFDPSEIASYNAGQRDDIARIQSGVQAYEREEVSEIGNKVLGNRSDAN